MANYVVLARKWRPAQFSDVVGQTPVVRTLMSAVQKNRVHQGYLFTGSRGVGKTSIARIFAKLLRCENSSEQDGWLVSCDACSSCKEITSGTSVDVIEIDGASNNGVDSVREIRENAKYLPSSGSRKLYIIDEVHMLTTAAFNALLKTLEEPPEHVVFIFATTEPHKIPATILSRVQRFDFRRVNLEQTQARLEYILAQEKINAEPGALAIVARAAEGSMRDALSLLDQLIAFSEGTLSTQGARDCVGLVGSVTLLNYLGAVFARQPQTALSVLQEIHAHGFDLKVFARNIVEFLHAAILSKVSAPKDVTQTLGLSPDEYAEISKRAEVRTLEELELIFQAFHYAMESLARSPQPRLFLDILTIKCATAHALVQARALDAAAVTVTPAVIPTATPALASAPVATGAPVHTPSPTSPAPVTTPSSAALSWEGLIDAVRASRPLLASVLEHGACLQTPRKDSDVLEIGYRTEDSYFSDQLKSRVYAEQLQQLARAYFGRNVRIQVTQGDHAAPSLAQQKASAHAEKKEQILSHAQNHPVIIEAKSLFGGELGPIEVSSESVDG